MFATTVMHQAPLLSPQGRAATQPSANVRWLYYAPGDAGPQAGPTDPGLVALAQEWAETGLLAGFAAHWEAVGSPAMRWNPGDPLDGLAFGEPSLPGDPGSLVQFVEDAITETPGESTLLVLNGYGLVGREVPFPAQPDEPLMHPNRILGYPSQTGSFPIPSELGVALDHVRRVLGQPLAAVFFDHAQSLTLELLAELGDSARLVVGSATGCSLTRVHYPAAWNAVQHARDDQSFARAFTDAWSPLAECDDLAAVQLDAEGMTRATDAFVAFGFNLAKHLAADATRLEAAGRLFSRLAGEADGRPVSVSTLLHAIQEQTTPPQNVKNAAKAIQEGLAQAVLARASFHRRPTDLPIGVHLPASAEAYAQWRPELTRNRFYAQTRWDRVLDLVYRIG